MNKYALMLPLGILSVFLGYFGSSLKMEHLYAIATVTAVFVAITGYSLFFKRLRKSKQGDTIVSRKTINE